MINPNAEDLGKTVYYIGNFNGPIESGIITSITEKYVFVRYENQHPTAPGKATDRSNLIWHLSEVKNDH